MLKKVITYSFLSAVITLVITSMILKLMFLDPGLRSAGLGAVAALFGVGIILFATSAILVFIFSWRKFRSIATSFVILLLTAAWTFAIFSILNGRFQEGLVDIFQKISNNMK